MPAKRVPRPAEEVGWTVRMPASLAKRIRERAEALTAKGNGKWNGNMVMLKAINAAAETWDEESSK